MACARGRTYSDRVIDAPTDVADLGLLPPGTHLCAFGTDGPPLDQVASTFIGQGLAAGDQLLYVASEQQVDTLLGLLPAHLDATVALSTGQLQVSSFADAYGTRRPDDLGAVADGFRAAAALSRKRGFPGLRVAARMDALPELLGSFEEVVQWEHMSTELQREIGVTSVCLYDTARLGTGHADQIAQEHAGLAPSIDAPPLATFLAVEEPWGLRVSGEVDLSNRDLLQRMLLSRADVYPSLRLDLSGLTFADLGVVARLRAVAAGLPEGGSLVLDRVPDVVRRILDITGLGHERLRLEP